MQKEAACLLLCIDMVEFEFLVWKIVLKKLQEMVCSLSNFVYIQLSSAA